MNQSEILAMCKNLSSKYQAGHQREDLIQEGVLACYELLSKNPEAEGGALNRAANRAMWDYLNLAGGPVSVPKQKTARTLKSGSQAKITQTYNEKGLQELEAAVKATTTPIEEGHMTVDGAEVAFEEREFLRYVMAKADEVLTAEERKIIKMRYEYDMPLEVVGNEMKMTKQAVSLKETAALEKLRRRL